MADRPYGLLAEFDSPEALLEAVRSVRKAGYRKLDAFTPFPVEGLAGILRIPRPRIALVGLIGGFAGAAFALLMQGYVNYDYPINLCAVDDIRNVVAKRLASAELPRVRRQAVSSREQGSIFSMHQRRRC
jgi:hypothetical protein